MNRITTATAALLATTALAHAGGVERNGATPAILFEDGTYVELGYTYVDPTVSGTQTLDLTVPLGAPAGSGTGDIAPSYDYFTFSFRQDITEDLSFALIYDEPIGADVNYSGIGGPPGYLYRFGLGSQATIESQQVTAALRYELNENFSVYGGLRAVTAEGNVALFAGSGANPAAGDAYGMSAEGSTEVGYMLGAAYERTDIAMRVALTYYSATDHTFTATETVAPGLAFPTTFQTTIPQQLLLEAQTGVAEGTLVFGSIRWVDWTSFDITPDVFSDGVPNGLFGANSLVDYDNDTITYTIGGARVLTDNWTVLGSYTFEEQQGGFAGNLGPTDGRNSLGLGVRYTQGPLRITAGANYSWIGDAQTEAPSSLGLPPGTQFATFTDNDSVGFGLRIGYSF